MSTEAPRVIPGHEHSRIDLHNGQLVLIWPDDMDKETFLFVEHVIDALLAEKRRILMVDVRPKMGSTHKNPKYDQH